MHICASIQIYHKFTTETKIMYENTLFGTKKKKSQRLNYHILGHF